MNPFNQMITRDSKLAKMFYSYDTASSHAGMSTKAGSLVTTKKQAAVGSLGGASLTLENLKLHDKFT